MVREDFWRGNLALMLLAAPARGVEAYSARASMVF